MRKSKEELIVLSITPSTSPVGLSKILCAWPTIGSSALLCVECAWKSEVPTTLALLTLPLLKERCQSSLDPLVELFTSSVASGLLGT